jgi:hypothetical protein
MAFTSRNQGKSRFRLWINSSLTVLTNNGAAGMGDA